LELVQHESLSKKHGAGLAKKKQKREPRAAVLPVDINTKEQLGGYY